MFPFRFAFKLTLVENLYTLNFFPYFPSCLLLIKYILFGVRYTTVALQFDMAFSLRHWIWRRRMQLLFLIGSFSALFSGALACWSVSFTLTPAWYNIWESSLETAGSSLVFGVLWHWKVTCIWCFSWVFARYFDAFYKAVKCCFADSAGLVTVAVPFSSESRTLRGTHLSLGSE